MEHVTSWSEEFEKRRDFAEICFWVSLLLGSTLHKTTISHLWKFGESASKVVFWEGICDRSQGKATMRKLEILKNPFQPVSSK